MNNADQMRVVMSICRAGYVAVVVSSSLAIISMMVMRMAAYHLGISGTLAGCASCT